MIQWIIVGISVAVAGYYIGWMISRAIKHRGCPGCAASSKTMKLLKKLEKKTKR